MAEENQGAGPVTGNPTKGSGAGANAAESVVTNLATLLGKGVASASQGGAADSGNAGTGSAQQTELPGFAAGLTKETKGDQKVAQFVSKFKTMDDLVRASMGLEGKLGSMVSIPGDNATEEERAEFYKKLGVPESEDGYEIQADDRFDPTTIDLKGVKALAKDLGLTKTQANKLYKTMTDQVAAQFEAHESATKAAEAEALKLAEKAQADCDNSLKAEWGQKYEENNKLALRAINHLGGKSIMEELNKLGGGNSPLVFKMLAAIGQGLREDSATGQAGTPRQSRDVADIMYPSQR